MTIGFLIAATTVQAVHVDGVTECARAMEPESFAYTKLQDGKDYLTVEAEIYGDAIEWMHPRDDGLIHQVWLYHSKGLLPDLDAVFKMAMKWCKYEYDVSK